MNKQAYYNSLPKKQMAAGALFFNKSGELLILHPIYKDRWEIPGGMIEKDESPRFALIREIKEELGLSVDVQQMLVCDYWRAADGRPDNLQFVFCGGILSDEQIASIRPEEKEIGSYEFVSVESADDMKKLAERERVGPRVVLALEALKHNQCYYLEEAKRVG